MTAEIAIMNKHAVALAADSAVTAGDKIFQSANKIFALSKYKPVGVMIYSSAEYCGIPWESIIKDYRRNYPNVKFRKLSSYARHFLRFLRCNNIIRENKYSDKFMIADIAIKFANDIQNSMLNTASKLENNHKIDINTFKIKARFLLIDIFSAIIYSKECKIQKNVPFNDFVSQNIDMLREIYYNYKISKYENIIPDLWLLFVESVHSLLTCAIYPFGSSGLVFAGFGDDEIYPRLYSYNIGYSLENHVHYSKEHDVVIDNNNSASVTPFAQGDIIGLFMDGIHLDIQEEIKRICFSILTEYSKSLINILNVGGKKYKSVSKKIEQMDIDIVGKLINDISSMKEGFWRPTINTISLMAPIEIAKLAESLVSITSMHRRVAYQKETVGGPTDVALISKGDGLVWIKRKHYFDPHLNPYFFNRNNIEVRYGKD